MLENGEHETAAGIGRGGGTFGEIRNGEQEHDKLSSTSPVVAICLVQSMRRLSVSQAQVSLRSEGAWIDSGERLLTDGDKMGQWSSPRIVIPEPGGHPGSIDRREFALGGCGGGSAELRRSRVNVLAQQHFTSMEQWIPDALRASGIV